MKNNFSTGTITTMLKYNKRGKIVLIVMSAFMTLSVIVLFLSSFHTTSAGTIQYGEITMRDVEITVSSTGTIKAQKSVVVSTQVSGKIVNVYADNNDTVKKGEVLAKIDSQLLEISVKTAEAELLKAKSHYELALHEYTSTIELNKEKLVSNLQLEKLRVTKDGAYADYLSAQSRLLTAKTNLEYSVITSPINGIVLEKNVEEGQTVAASLSAPALFTIAESLLKIEINALVSESDIGSIKKDQKARFTVEAYPEMQFEGVVTSVLLNGTVSSNVVNYQVIISASNSEKKLLPGMTATIDFVINSVEQALVVPNSALEFRPSPEMLRELGVVRPEMPKGNGKGFPPPPPDNKNASGKSIWIKGENNLISLVRVETGITDGQYTVISGDGITAGDSVITGSKSKAETKKSDSNTGKKQNANRSGAGGPPGGMPPMMF